MDGFNIDLEPCLENLECSTSFWWDTSDQDLTKTLKDHHLQSKVRQWNQAIKNPPEHPINVLLAPSVRYKFLHWVNPLFQLPLKQNYSLVFSDWAASQNMHQDTDQWLSRSAQLGLQCFSAEQVAHFVCSWGYQEEWRAALPSRHYLCSSVCHMTSLMTLCLTSLAGKIHVAHSRSWIELQIDTTGTYVPVVMVLKEVCPTIYWWGIEKLWALGILGTDSPWALLNAVFFLCVSGHYSLKISQIRWMKDEDGYVYCENGSKNRSGGLQDFRVPNKQVSIYSCPEAQDRCHMYILDLYLSKLPVQAFIDDSFYMQPLSVIPQASHLPWFANTHTGKKMLLQKCWQPYVVRLEQRRRLTVRVASVTHKVFMRHWSHSHG